MVITIKAKINRQISHGAKALVGAGICQMTARPRQTEARIARALAAWAKAGLAVGGLEIAPDGTVRILASAPAGPQVAKTTPDDPFDLVDMGR